VQTNVATSVPEQALRADRERIENKLAAILDCGGLEPENPVRGAMRYAVLGSGKRVRPLLALRVGRMLNADSRLTLRAAAAVELVHCASLVVDDLPCMDNDAYRRNRPAAHVVFGESTAILAGFGLVALAARAVLEQTLDEWERARMSEFQLELLRTLDVCELLGGQALDLRLSGYAREAERERMNELKTSPLFRLAAHAGFAGACVTRETEATLLRFGHEFGRAFQMLDDLLDGETGFREGFEVSLNSARDCLSGWNGTARGLDDLLNYLHASAEKDSDNR
jgi:farnesyl diphosphate synthase